MSIDEAAFLSIGEKGDSSGDIVGHGEAANGHASYDVGVCVTSSNPGRPHPSRFLPSQGKLHEHEASVWYMLRMTVALSMSPPFLSSPLSSSSPQSPWAHRISPLHRRWGGANGMLTE